MEGGSPLWKDNPAGIIDLSFVYISGTLGTL